MRGSNIVAAGGGEIERLGRRFALRHPRIVGMRAASPHLPAAVRQITQGCIEILRPMGISREHLLEKWFRDVRITDGSQGDGSRAHL